MQSTASHCGHRLVDQCPKSLLHGQQYAPSINTNSNMMVAKLKLKVKDLGKQKLATRKGDFHSALIHLAPHM